MVRTGHFTAGSILRQTKYLWPEWGILSGKGIAEVIYNKLEKLQPQAIKLATKLWNSHDQNTNLELHEIERLIKKHNINPSTTVYKLVEKLIEYLK